MDRVTRARRAGPLVLLMTLLGGAPAFAQVDLSGVWAVRYHEDSFERVQGSELGDYLGLPLNDEARLRADAWSAENSRAARMSTHFKKLPGTSAWELEPCRRDERFAV